MKYQSLFSGKIRKNIISLSSADLAKRVVEVKVQNSCISYYIPGIQNIYRGYMYIVFVFSVIIFVCLSVCLCKCCFFFVCFFFFTSKNSQELLHLGF